MEHHDGLVECRTAVVCGIAFCAMCQTRGDFPRDGNARAGRRRDPNGIRTHCRAKEAKSSIDTIGRRWLGIEADRAVEALLRASADRHRGTTASWSQCRVRRTSCRRAPCRLLPAISLETPSQNVTMTGVRSNSVSTSPRSSRWPFRRKAFQMAADAGNTRKATSASYFAPHDVVPRDEFGRGASTSSRSSLGCST